MSINSSGEAELAAQVESFEDVFRLYQRRVYTVCLRMSGNKTDAEDLTQEVFVQLFRQLKSFRGESAFTTWLYRVTVNQVLMHFRKINRRRDRLTNDGELPEQTLPRPSIQRGPTIIDRIALNEAIIKLAPGYRTVFVLHDIEGFGHPEIADILGCSVGTSKSQLHKARLKLRHLLRHHRRAAVRAKSDFEQRPKATLQSIVPQLRGAI
jgi:RNA polymerase sigma-70 factor (ECF subfamily)